MKRKSAAALAILVCFMLSACSGQTAPTAATVSEPSSSESNSEAVSAPESSEPTANYVERIDLAVTSFDGFVGDAVVITPAVYPTMVKDAVLEYKSTDESVVVVSEDGSGTLTGVGSAEIVVTDTGSGVEARFSVTSQAVPQTSKPTSGGTQSQQGSQSQSGSQQQQGTGNAQQGGTQQQQPSGGTQAPSGDSTGGMPPRREADTTDSAEAQKSFQHQVDQAERGSEYWDETGIDWSGISEDFYK